jgi:hypothetical protein
MTRIWRITAWIIYTVGCFLIMLIGFSWRTSLPVSIIVGFFCGLVNELIQVLLKIFKQLGGDINAA